MQNYGNAVWPERVAAELRGSGRWRGARKVSGLLTLCYDEWQAAWRGGAYQVEYRVLGTANHGEHNLTESFARISDLEKWVTKYFEVDPEHLMETIQEFKMRVAATKLAVS
jgi:hypothetical protein